MSECQHHIYQLQPTRTAMVTEGPDEHEGPILAAHYDYLMALGASGKLSLVGRTANNDENTFGLVVINSGDNTEAREIMENDPAVKNEIMNAQLYPFSKAFP